LRNEGTCKKSGTCKLVKKKHTQKNRR